MINWKWPSTKENTWIPWYLIAWRVIWTIPLLIGFGFMYVSLFCGRGPKEANRFWEEVV